MEFFLRTPEETENECSLMKKWFIYASAKAKSGEIEPSSR